MPAKVQKVKKIYNFYQVITLIKLIHLSFRLIDRLSGEKQTIYAEY